jgi:MtaA/CmuA family methyltransferase
MNGRDRVLAAMRGDATDQLPLMPITMMFASRQAGVLYGDYAADSTILADAQLAVAERFDFDYVSVISDPAREAADCGADVEYFADQPPAINEMNALLTDRTSLATLQQPNPLGGGRMHDRVKGVARLKEKVGDDLLVEGWVEGPCAQAADLRGINALMLDFMDAPAFVEDLFVFVVELELAFARAQVAAGADLIGVGDAAASLTGPALYNELVWKHEKMLVDGIHEMGVPVRLHICGNTNRIVDGMGRLGCEIVDLDYPVDMAAARAAMGPDQLLLGNMDPVAVLLNASAAEVTEAVAACHRQAGRRYIVGAGCEIPPATTAENVLALTRYAQTAAETSDG